MVGEEVFLMFPDSIRELLREMGLEGGAEGLQELRIRTGRPLLARCEGRERASDRAVERGQVRELLSYLGNYSLYAYEDEIRQGFLSLPGGHRVGLAGKVIVEGRRIKTLSEISSLNIRFAHERKGCADRLLPKLWEGERLCHTLIVSAPGRGKTTLLRDCVRQISDGSQIHEGKTVGLVDERSEIAGCFRGVPGNDVGLRTDVLDGCPKAEGMMMLIRSMAPDVVAVDEIGSQEDLEALAHARNCGCVLIATMHGDSMEEIERRLALQGMFERIVFLESRKLPGRIGEILDGRGRPLEGV